MLQLTAEEHAPLISQIATSNTGRGGRRKLPLAFAEHGSLMAATVLNASRAVQVSLHVVRAFVQLREALATHGDLAVKLADLEHKAELLALKHESLAQNTRVQLQQLLDAIRSSTAPAEAPRKLPIGCVAQKDLPIAIAYPCCIRCNRE
jgi:hypothetical protein